MSRAASAIRMNFTFGNPAVRSFRGSMNLMPDELHPFDIMTKQDAIVSCVVCILDIPLRVPLTELRAFVAEHELSITHMLVIRPENVLEDSESDSTTIQSNQSYCVLVRLSDVRAANLFRISLHHTPFNSIEPEQARVLSLTSIEFDDAAAEVAGFPVDVTPIKPNQTTISEHLKHQDSCPVCLESILDGPEMAGSIVTLCAHRFHIDCLCRWADTSCPVCRFNLAQEESASCEECDRRDDLWMCLVCGFVGCGRMQGRHAIDHFHQSGHAYACEVRGAARRVWSYEQDGFVHRLLASEDSSKGPQEPPIAASAPDARARRRRLMERRTSLKLEAMVCEYNHLLADHMTRQRARASEQLNRLERTRAPQLAAAKQTLISLQHELDMANQRCSEAAAAADIARRSTHDVEKATSVSSDECSRLKSENDRLLKQIAELRAANQAQRAGRLKECDERIASLQEQLQDLEFYNTMSKATQGNAELASGAIYMAAAPAPVPAASSSSAHGRRQRRGGRRGG